MRLTHDEEREGCGVSCSGCGQTPPPEDRWEPNPEDWIWIDGTWFCDEPCALKAGYTQREVRDGTVR